MGRVAKKSDRALWEKAKAMACSKGKLCKHSARKMQWATRYYQKHGGRYEGRKSSRNSLSTWGKQKWRTSSRRASRGKLRYLPDSAWKALTPSERARTNRAKLRGYRRGEQYVRQPADIARKTRAHRASRRGARRRRSRRSGRAGAAGSRRRSRSCKKGSKKFAKWVRGLDGDLHCVRFGDPAATIKKHIPSRKRSFCARHRCASKRDPATPGYQSCKAWDCKVAARA